MRFFRKRLIYRLCYKDIIMVEILLGLLKKSAIQANEWLFYFSLGRNTIKGVLSGRNTIKVGRNTIRVYSLSVEILLGSVEILLCFFFSGRNTIRVGRHTISGGRNTIRLLRY